ncbi:MAG: hydroxymethylbilane synthase [bacterium]|nr:hydroxymethylbilane synthase [bacterium]
MNLLRLGTRGSALALWQARWVEGALRAAHPDLEVEIVILRTEGDRRQDVSLASFGGAGVFVAELERALVAGEIDFAVHSAKDMPGRLAGGTEIAAFMPREDAHDVLISTRHAHLAELPADARIGTGSVRRVAQLRHHHPGWRFEDLRGNLDTRLAKLDHQGFDAIVLAAAGLVRLGWGDRITERLPTVLCLPAVGQGAVAVQVRSGDPVTRDLVAAIDHAETHACVTAERALLQTLQAGCQAPVAGHCRMAGEYLQMVARVMSLDGATLLERVLEGPPAKPRELGEHLGHELLEAGARALLSR